MPSGWKSPADGGLPFLFFGGLAQERYEGLRAYMLRPRAQRPRAHPARFDLGRFERFGLLGLLERDPLGEAWGHWRTEDYRVEVIPVGSSEAPDRWTRLSRLLYRLATATEGGAHASSRALRPGVQRPAGEGTDDREPAGRHHAVR